MAGYAPVPTQPELRKRSFFAATLRGASRAADTDIYADREDMNRSGSYQAAMLTIARQRAEIETLCCKLSEMQQSGARKSSIMAAAGHDLKQPLHIISRAIETLGPPVSDHTLQMWFDAASQQIGRLADGLTHLALASQEDEAEVGSVRVRPLSMAGIMDGLERDWRLAAADKGLELRVVGSSLSIMSDSRILSTILGNLVGNAIKYTERGGVLVGCRPLGRSVQIAIIDTGCGINASEMTRIFEPFVQCGPARGGMGIGLSLVRALCHSLAHEISVSSRSNEGSRFTLTVPRCDEDRAK